MSNTKVDKLKSEQISITEKACERFKGIASNIKVPKLKYLHRSLNFKSLIHEQENNGKTYKYQKYKRGAVVMVNFGTNIGYELSGNHFAIVLNKDDNNKNGLLTIVPLTSKCKKHYLELKDSIYDLVLGAQNQYIAMLTDTQEMHSNHRQELNSKLSVAKENLDKIKELTEEEDCLSKYNEILNKMFFEQDKYMKQINELSSITNQESKEIDSNMRKIHEVLDKYNEKNKTSFAMIRNITTISKLKVLKPINKFDPIGKMNMSNSSLNKIDYELRKTFTYCDEKSLD